VLQASESPSEAELSPREFERLKKVRVAREEREAAKARQATLRELIKEGSRSIRKVKLAVSEHPEDVNGKDEHGRSMFWLAVLGGHADLLEVLANAGASVDEEAADGATALFAACAAGNRAVVETLLELGCNPERAKRGPDGGTALYVACQRGEIGCVEALLEHGVAFVDKPAAHGSTPLFISCSAGELDIARLLLFGGADCELRGLHGASAFMAAAEGDHLECCQLLIDWGADPDHTASTHTISRRL
jgi:hypothetical protein